MPMTRRPYLTYAIIAACVAVWVGERVSLALYADVVLYRPLLSSQPWRIITSGFAHDRVQITHILFNMASLYYLGTFLEARIGHLRFAVIYLASVIVGALTFVAMRPDGLMVGASGGVFGLMCAALVVGLREHREVGSLAGLIVLNAIMSFASPQVAWQDHLGGAIAGAVLALVLVRRRGAPTPPSAIEV